MELIRKDYDKNLAAMIPAEMPVFILLASDPLSLKVLTYYLQHFQVSEDDPQSKIYYDFIEQAISRFRMHQTHMQDKGILLTYPAIVHEGSLTAAPEPTRTFAELETALSQIVHLQTSIHQYRGVIADLQADKADTERMKKELEQGEDIITNLSQLNDDLKKDLKFVMDGFNLATETAKILEQTVNKYKDENHSYELEIKKLREENEQQKAILDKIDKMV